MKNYSSWMNNASSNEELVFDMCKKDVVLVNDSLECESIVNDANQWQTDVDLIWMTKKVDFTPTIGDYFTYKNNYYMVFFVPEERETYWSCKARLCNTFLTIKGKPVPIDYDKFGNPVTFSDGEDYIFVCVADKSLVYGSADLNNAINLPDNKIKVTIPYTDMKLDEFILYDELYRVRDIDLTQTLGNKGLITITGERKVE